MYVPVTSLAFVTPKIVSESPKRSFKILFATSAFVYFVVESLFAITELITNFVVPSAIEVPL